MIVYSFWASKPDDFEFSSGDSMTIPDQSLTVRDILLRYVRGQMTLPSDPDTSDDDDIDDYSRDSFDDFVDALDDFETGSLIVDNLRQSQQSSDDSETVDSSSNTDLSE